MATFGVHVSVGISASGLAATSLMLAGLASPREMLIYLALGSVGSLLPDLDADNSTPVRVGFSLVSIGIAFAVLFQLAHLFPSVAELALIWLVTYLSCRWLVFALFSYLTIHRGIFHSVPAAALCGLLTTAGAWRFAGQAPVQAWLAGAFVTFGYLVHLLLDEVYSVNLFGLRVRRSLGSAFKFWSRPSPLASILVYAACAGAFLFTPDPGYFLRILTAETTVARLLPTGSWFHPGKPSPAFSERVPPSSPPRKPNG